MKMNKLALSLVVAMGIASGMAQAATNGGSGTVKFNGAIVDAPCGIDPSTNSQTVEMGTTTMKSLDKSGKSVSIPFEIKLQSCDATASKVEIAFDGVAADSSKKLLALANGTASGAGVGIMNHAGEEVVLGTAVSASDALTEGDNTLNFQAFVQGLGASVTAGSYYTTANFTLQYN